MIATMRYVNGHEVELLTGPAVACGGANDIDCPNDGIVRVDGISFCGPCARIEIGPQPVRENEEGIR